MRRRAISAWGLEDEEESAGAVGAAVVEAEAEELDPSAGADEDAVSAAAGCSIVPAAGTSGRGAEPVLCYQPSAIRPAG
jgi:hypothetical protein